MRRRGRRAPVATGRVEAVRVEKFGGLVFRAGLRFGTLKPPLFEARRRRERLAGVVHAVPGILVVRSTLVPDEERRSAGFADVGMARPGTFLWRALAGGEEVERDVLDRFPRREEAFLVTTADHVALGHV